MHNCRRTQNDLIDLLFDELPASKRTHVLAELETCDECQQHYSSLTETLALFDDAANAALPQSETFWPAYHERLRNSLNESPAHPLRSERETKRLSLWRRAFSMRVQIPVPALAAAALIIVASFASLLWQRSPAAAAEQHADDSTAGARASMNAGSNDSFRESQSKIIEVPVVRERIVTRVIYLHRGTVQQRNGNAPQINNRFKMSEPEEQTLARNAAISTRPPLAGLSLDGFQPTNDVRLTVIKAVEKDQ